MDYTAHSVEAEITLLPAQAGGLSEPLVNGSRSLLVRFSPLLEEGDSVMIGASLEAISCDEFKPESRDLAVRMHFWGAGEACILAQPKVVFSLWYNRRSVGQGIITKVVG